MDRLVTYFRSTVIEPVISRMSLTSGIDLGGTAAEELLVGIAVHESDGLLYARQVQGPAIGPYQMEPATFEDLHENFLRYQPKLLKAVNEWRAFSTSYAEMAFNGWYATAMARANLYRFPEKLPAAGDLVGQAAYWRRHWNTPLGKGTVEQYIAHWNKYVCRSEV